MARKSERHETVVAPPSGGRDYPEAAITGHAAPQGVDANGFAGNTVNDIEVDPNQGEIIEPHPGFAQEYPRTPAEAAVPDDYDPLADSEEEEGTGGFEGDWLQGAPQANDPLAALQGAKADDGSFLKGGQKKTFAYDFRDVEDGPPKLDPGVYCAKLIDVDEEESKSSGVPQWVWQFVVTKGPKRNFKMRFWTSLSKDARWKAAQTLKALGVKTAGAMGEWGAADVIGRPVKIEVYLDNYQGEQRSKIKTVHPPDEEAIAAAFEARDLV